MQVNGEELPTPEEFTYLDNTFRCDGGAGNDEEPSQQGHKCLQNPQQFLEVPAVIYINQAEAVPELCTFSLVIRLRVLQDDCQ